MKCLSKFVVLIFLFVSPVVSRLGGERELGGRKNCSHFYHTNLTYKICLNGNHAKCLRMTSKSTVKFETYNSDNEFRWKLIETTVAAGNRVRLENKGHAHNLIASDVGGNDGASAMKISQSSSCGLNDPVKISYLDPNGTPSNDWLKNTSDGLKWKPKSRQGTKFILIAT